MNAANPPPFWTAAAEQGLHGVHLAESVGGQGFGILELAIVIAEFGREPDSFLGLLAFGLSMGQWLCIPMILGGIWLFVWARR